MRRSTLGWIPICCLLVATFSSTTHGGDWPGWRGPNRDGSQSGGDALAGKATLSIGWKVPLGSAYSGIAVSGGRVVTLFSDGKQDHLTAHAVKSGEELWRRSIGETYKGHDGSDDGPLATPVIDGDNVYALGPTGLLIAVKLADGKELWRVDTAGALGARKPYYGFSSSPLVVGRVLFVQLGGTEGKSLAGFDKTTGAVLWTTGEELVGYQSPIVAELAGRAQIVAVANQVVYGIVPETGEVLWQHQWDEQKGDTSATPVLLGGNRFLLTGRTDSVALEVGRADGGFAIQEVWRTRSLKGSYAVPVLYEGHLYGFDTSFLSCVKAEDGTRVWKSRPPGGHAVILVDDHLAVFNDEGDLVIARASPAGYEERARIDVAEEGGWTGPSFAAGHFFVRNLTELARIDIGAPAAKPEGSEATGAGGS